MNLGVSPRENVHRISTAGEIFIASKRTRLSWFNAGWMLGGAAVYLVVEVRAV